MRPRRTVLFFFAAVALSSAALASCHAMLDIEDVAFDDGAGGATTSSTGGSGATTGGGMPTGVGGVGGMGGVGGAGGGASGGAGGCVLGPFGNVTNVAAVNSSVTERDPSISADGHVLTFTSHRTGTIGQSDLWQASRASVTLPFGDLVILTALNSATYEVAPQLSVDQLRIYFGSTRSGGAGAVDIYTASRAVVTASFGAPALVTELVTASNDGDPSPTSDELTIAISSDRPGGAGLRDIFMASRSDVGSAFDSPVNIAELNTSADDSDPDLSPDGLTIHFSSDRAGSLGDRDLYVATRSNRTSAFGAPTHLSGISSTARDGSPSLSADGLTLYFASDRPGGVGERDVWVATRSCE